MPNHKFAEASLIPDLTTHAHSIHGAIGSNQESIKHFMENIVQSVTPPPVDSKKFFTSLAYQEAGLLGGKIVEEGIPGVSGVVGEAKNRMEFINSAPNIQQKYLRIGEIGSEDLVRAGLAAYGDDGGLGQGAAGFLLGLTNKGQQNILDYNDRYGINFRKRTIKQLQDSIYEAKSKGFNARAKNLTNAITFQKQKIADAKEFKKQLDEVGRRKLND